MSRLKIKKGVKVSEETFEKFGQDLTTFLEAFPFRLLAEWWGKNKGNLSRKLKRICGRK